MIRRDVDLNSEEWRNFVFENKNKEYGAYYLRKTSTLRHVFALFFVIAATAIVIFLFKIIHFDQDQQIKDSDYEVKPIELSSLIELEEHRENINQIVPEEKPQLKEIVQFTPPIIEKDENIVEDLKELQETDLSPDSTDTASELEDSLLLAQETAQANKEEDENDSVATNEKNRNAAFQDGKAALLRYIYQNIHYPPEALKKRINGRVVCSFIVNEDGSLSDITLVKGVYASLDEEVQRVIRSMPLWKPALKDGKAVKIKYVMPVVFKLN